MAITPKDIRDLPLRDIDPTAVDELTLLLADPPSNPAHVSAAMTRANELLEAHGVEAVYDDRGGFSGYWQNIVALYVNMGDAYTATVLYDVRRGQFFVTTWGDFVGG